MSFKTENYKHAAASVIKKMEKRGMCGYYCETKEDIIRSGELNTIRDFLTECFNPESKTGKLIAGIKQAGNTVKNIACKYNSIAKWVGFPLVPFVGE